MCVFLVQTLNYKFDLQIIYETYLQSFVITSTDNEPTIRRPRNITDAHFVSRYCLLKLAIICSPYFYQFVSRCNKNQRKNRVTSYISRDNIMYLINNNFEFSKKFHKEKCKSNTSRSQKILFGNEYLYKCKRSR